MKVICSYCRKKLPDKEPVDDDRVTHTVCPECFGHFMQQLDGLPLERYLDNFEVPVMIVDADCRIVAANQRASDMTGRPRREILGLLGGEALECFYSRLPGGCGQTVHCETCTIRQTVHNAIASESPQQRVEVRIKHDDRVMAITLSVVKVGEFVRIMIEN